MTSDLMRALEPKSDQINADDLIAGDLVVTISGIKVTPGTEQPVSISLVGMEKVWRPCKTTGRVMVRVWGEDEKMWVGKSLKLYREPNVKWGALTLGGIRISEMSDMDGPMTLVLTAKKGKFEPAVIKPLKIAASTPRPSPPPPSSPATIPPAALDAARKGTEAFRAWWTAAGADERAPVLPLMDEIKKICAVADKPADEIPQDDDPFSTGTTADAADFR